MWARGSGALWVLGVRCVHEMHVEQSGQVTLQTHCVRNAAGCLLPRPLDMPARAPLACAGLGTEKAREDDGPGRGARAARARLTKREIGEGRGREEGRTKEGEERGARRGKGQKSGGSAEEEGADGSDEVVDASHLKPLKRLLDFLSLLP